MSKIRTGLDLIIERDFDLLRGQRVALLINQASVDYRYQHILEHISGRVDLELVKIFAPEHGLWGGPQDMEGVASSTEPLTNRPIISLYDGTAESLAPKEEDLDGIDTLVVDLPDVGSRYYTYAQTTALAMTVAGSCGVRVLILDRPNPINGVTIEGSSLKPPFRSFCGMLPVPQRHGLTLGEVAVLYETGFGPDGDAYPACRCELEIVEVEGWRRRDYLDECHGTWVIPSPNLPTLETAIVYPGMCLFEATNVSEGRGTTMPFLYVGAPFIDPFVWRGAIRKERLELRGAELRPISFIPKFQKWANQECHGLQIHVTDRRAFRPFRLALAMISALRKIAPDDFQWRSDAYEFVDKVPAIDLLYGTDRFRNIVDSSGDLSTLEPEISQFEQWFSSAREPYLRY